MLLLCFSFPMHVNPCSGSFVAALLLLCSKSIENAAVYDTAGAVSGVPLLEE